MARVYAVASAKGGVGKTTTTANLGVALAAAGHRVAVVDADVGMPNLGRTLGLPVDPDGPTVHDVLAGEAAPLEAVFDGPRGLDVVPGSTSLDAYASADPRKLRDVLDALDADGYDLVLLDTGAGLSHDTALPLGLADALVLVSTASPDALGDTDRTRQLAARVGTPVAGLVLTRVDAARTDADAVAAELGLDLLAVVPEDPAVGDATTDGEPVVTRDVDAPAAAAYRTLAGAVAADAMDEPFDESAVVAETRTAAGDDRGLGGTDSDEAAAVDELDGRDAPETSTTEAVEAEPDDSEGATAEGGGIDVASVLGDESDDLDAAFDLDDETDGDGASDGPDDRGGTETGDGDHSSGDAGAVGDAEETTDAEAGVDTAARVDSDAGLASTLADVESGAGDGSETGTHDERRADSGDDPSDTTDADETEAVPVADAVDEAEPDSEGEVTFAATGDTAGSDETDVTIQPDDAADIPDAEAEADSDSETDRAADADRSSEAADGSPEADGGDDATDETDAEERPDDGDSDGSDESDGKKGLFGRFFG